MDAKETKTKSQRAAERAAILESLTDEDIATYRKRKVYVPVMHDWKDFFREMPAEEVKEMLLKIIEYDETGTLPKLKNPMNAAVFTGFMKNFIDNLFDDFCYTCYMAGSKGRNGGIANAINTKIAKLFIERHGREDIAGIDIKEIVRNPQKAFSSLEVKGMKRAEIAELKKALSEIRQEVEAEYNE